MERGHGLKLTHDKIAVIGELEHIRRHSLRSAQTLAAEQMNQPDGDTDISDEAYHYSVVADMAKDLRREYMSDNFGDIKDEDWCLCKSAACLRQLAYECCGGDIDRLSDIDNLVDTIWGHALGEDLSGCVACAEDAGKDGGDSIIDIEQLNSKTEGEL